jgi:hypothetical protein
MYEKRINRAVFDVMVCAFVNPTVRELSRGKEAAIESAYRNLCENDYRFLASIEQTTKSLDANRTRFSAWARVLGDVLGSEVKLPRMRATT